MARYRRGAVFVMSPLALSTPLDRNQRAKLLFFAEAFERRTKAPGRMNGAISLVGLAVLRALLFEFMNRHNGLCCPSYTALQAKTGFCRQTIAAAISRLEAAGILTITRRIVRERINICGTWIVRAVQGSNLYAFNILYDNPCAVQGFSRVCGTVRIPPKRQSGRRSRLLNSFQTPLDAIKTAIYAVNPAIHGG